MKNNIYMLLLFPLLSVGSTIGDRVWLDSNQNWEEDAAEQGLAGVTVKLYNKHHDVLKTTKTDVKGYYHFTNVQDREQHVEVQLPLGYISTTPKRLDYWEDYDVDNLDFGLYQTNFNIISKVWYDKNENWEHEADEIGVAYVTVELYDENNNKLQTTQTDLKGEYRFLNLNEGEYRVKVVPSTNQTIVTSQTIEFWLEKDRKDLEFGIAGAIDLNPPLRLADLKKMIKNGEDVTSVNTSKITDMSNLFYNTSFNQDISKWDVSNVTDMSNMFAGDHHNPPIFNQDISTWNVSKVTNMSGMFSSKSRWVSSAFNQDINNWDVSSVTDMSEMFHRATNFQHSLANWNVSKVTNMHSMFDASNYNKDISNWDVSSVTDMSNMFDNNTVFNQNINSWDVSKVNNMDSMFSHTRSFNQPLENWDVSSVTNMHAMFAYSLFDQPIEKWDVSDVKDMSKMFYWWASFTTNFNQPLAKWDVSSVENMSEMFAQNTLFNQDISKWNVNKVTTWNDIFNGTRKMKEEYKPLKFR